jgi:hypothetical protein
MSNLGMLKEVRPGDFFHMTEAGLEGGTALLIWTLPCEVRIAIGGGIDVPGCDIGYLIDGVLKSGRFKSAKEVNFPWARSTT